MKIVLSKSLKRKIVKKLNRLQFCIKYFIHHPLVIVKAIFVLLLEGFDSFSRKLLRAEQRQRKYSPKHRNYSKYLDPKFWVRKISILLTRLVKISISIIFPLLYFLIVLIFFIAYKFTSFVVSIIKTKMEIPRDKLPLDGISFVIPTWNKKDMVVECVRHLDNIATSENPSLLKEIIVIDNGSIDHTYEALLALKTKTPLNVIRSDTNLGFARGINLGASEAKYNYLYLMNNDMIPKPKLISEIVTFAQRLLKQHKPFFGLSSQIFFYDPTKRREESGKNYYRPDFGYVYVAHCVNDENLLSPSITGYPGGGSSLINRALFLQLGGYDKDVYLPLYDEDMDLGFIAWKLGFPSYFVPTSQIIHHHRSSSKKLSMDPNYYMFKNWLTFILKNYDSPSLIIRHLLFYPIRMYLDRRFIVYAWENIKILPIIFYKKLLLSAHTRVYADTQVINFPKFESQFKHSYET